MESAKVTEKWQELERLLQNLFTNEARILSDQEIEDFRIIAFENTPQKAAIVLAQKLRNSNIPGEIAEIVAGKFSKIIGCEVRVQAPEVIIPADLTAWATVVDDKKSDAEPKWF